MENEIVLFETEDHEGWIIQLSQILRQRLLIFLWSMLIMR